MTEEPDTETGAVTGKQPRHRSPNYPSIGLRGAVGKIQSLYRAGGLAPLMRITALTQMGFAKADGNAARVLSALRSFGLIEEVGDERVKLTQRGVDIVARQEGEAQRSQALRAAVSGPQIYHDLLTEYAASGIPPDAALKSELVAAKRFNPKSVDGFIQDFRETLEFAGVSNPSELELSIEDQIAMEDSVSPRLESTGSTVVVPPPPPRRSLDPGRAQTPARSVPAAGAVRDRAPLLTQTLVVSIPRDFNVEIGVRGDELKKGDLAKIKSQFNRWIEGLEEAFED